MRTYWTIGVFHLFYSMLSWSNPPSTSADLIMMDFEELVDMDVEFSSAGKLKSRVKDLPYPAYVLSANDIVQSGAQTLPEALRLIPGVFMGQISANEWFLAIRGSGGRFSRYVLIMVDGRIAFNNLFSGVNWDEMNLAIETIDRIEVVRGPNGATWGPNAVNGIIHIITKKQHREEKSSVSLLAGNLGHQGASMQWAKPLNEQWSLMFSAQYRQWDGLLRSGIEPEEREAGTENWRTQLSVARETSQHRTRLLFDTFGSTTSPNYTWATSSPPQNNTAAINDEKSGVVLLAEHNANLNRHFEYTLRTAIDSIDSESIIYDWNETNYQTDIELLSNVRNHRLSMGLNWRRSDTSVIYKDILQASITTPDRIIDHTGAYISDQISLGKKLSLNLSLRWDDHDLSQPATQPSARLMWQPNADSSIWLAHSQAVATPARTIVDNQNTPLFVTQTSSLPVIARFAGFDNSNSKATRISANEIGWRNTFNKFNIDLTLFDHHYENGLTANTSGPASVVADEFGNALYIDQQLLLGNTQNYETQGAELASRIQWLARWSTQLTVSGFKLKLIEGDIPANASSSESPEWSTTATLQNYLQLNKHWNLSAIFRHARGDFTTPDLPGLQGVGREQPVGNDTYVVADLNIIWTPNAQWRLSAMAKNLGKKHIEANREQFRSLPNLVEPYALFKTEYHF